MTAVQKWGNSLALRIPAALAERLDVSEGTPVELEVKAGALVVRPTRRPKHRLSDLLRGCRPRQVHGETDLGPDVGREAID